MRSTTYADVAEAIARAETEDARRAAGQMLATYYALGPMESRSERMRILREALSPPSSFEASSGA